MLLKFNCFVLCTHDVLHCFRLHKMLCLHIRYVNNNSLSLRMVRITYLSVKSQEHFMSARFTVGVSICVNHV